MTGWGGCDEAAASVLTYYAVARNADGKIGQLLVTRANGRQVSQEWTGVVYRSNSEAFADLRRLNCR
jgi:hypothetical protein